MDSVFMEFLFESYPFLGWTILVLGFITLYTTILLLVQLLLGFYKFFLMPKHPDLLKRYGGRGSWAVITGPNSGMGKRIALSLAERGFNMLILGYKSCNETRTELIVRAQSAGHEIEVRVVECDFSNAARLQEKFFEPIIKEIEENIGYDFAVMINNVGHRFGWYPYTTMPVQKIYDVVSVGTVVQARMCQLAIEKFMKRKNELGKQSLLLNTTALCMHPCALFSVGQLNSNIVVPYLSIYEATNIWGFAHSNSVYEEYKGKFDFLTITPGAVITESTQALLKSPFSRFLSVNVDDYSDTIVRFMGRVNGTHCAFWAHAFSFAGLSLLPVGAQWIKSKATRSVGTALADYFKQKEYESKYGKTL